MTKDELEEELRRNNLEWWTNCPVNRENIYICQECNGYIVTVDIDRGTTPMMVACKAIGCVGRMYSQGYPDGEKPDHIGVATWYWFRPECNALGLFDENPDVNDHVLHGGLLLRSIDHE